MAASSIGTALNEIDASILDADDALASGDFFPRLRREFAGLGGRLEECPFSDEYNGPVICWSEGWPYMEASKVQKELFT